MANKSISDLYDQISSKKTIVEDPVVVQEPVVVEEQFQKVFQKQEEDPFAKFAKQLAQNLKKENIVEKKIQQENEKVYLEESIQEQEFEGYEEAIEVKIPSSNALEKFFVELAQKLKEEKQKVDESQRIDIIQVNDNMPELEDYEDEEEDEDNFCLDESAVHEQGEESVSDSLGKFFINLAQTLKDSKEKIIAESIDEKPEIVQQKLIETQRTIYLEALEALSSNSSENIKSSEDEQISKYKQIASNQISQEIENLKKQIFHLQMGGGGGGTNAVQYAKGGTMDGDLYVTGAVTSNNNVALGNSTIYGTLSTLGKATFFDDVNFEKDITIRNSLTSFEGNVFFQKNLVVYGSLSAEGAINFAQNVTVGQDLVVYGNLSAFGNSYIEDTIFSTTTAISVVNTGIGPALYVYQGPGDYHVASFVDGDGVEVLHVGNASSLGGGGKIGINTSEPLATLHVSGSDGLILPVGNSSERINVQGTIRYNSQDQAFEGYDGANWGSLGGVKDVDQNTYISAEDYPGADNNELKLFTDGFERMRILSGGNVGIGVINPTSKLTIAGDLSTSDTITIGTIEEGLTNSVLIENGGAVQKREINSQIWDTTANFVSASEGTLEEGYIQKATNSGGIDKSVVFEDEFGKIGIGTNVPSTTLHISGSDGVVIPVGDTSQRVSVQGAIRYNSQDQAFEGYDGANWGSLGGVKDVDQNTYISAEDYPGADNNELKLFTDGFERMRILSGGNVGIGVEDPSKKLTVAGDLSASGEASVKLLSSSSVSFVVENGGLLQKRFLELSTIPQFTFTKNLTVSIDPSKSFGRYKNLDIIQSMGRTVSEVLEMVVVEPITPTVQFSVTSPAILFNQTSIANTLAFSHQISSLGADTQSGTFEWKRSNESTYQTLSSSTAKSGLLIHNTTNTNFNTNAFNYRYLVVDTVGASASATANTIMQNYVQPTVSLTVVGNSISSPETNSSREKGNVSSTISGTITRQSSFVALQSYQLQYRVNSGAWQNVGLSVSISDGATAAIAATVHNPVGDVSANSIAYRVQITDAFGTTTAATTSTINFNYFIFYGPTASAPTNSAQVRLLSNRTFTGVLSNPFNLVTGTTVTNFTVALPTAVAAHDVVTQVLDLDALNANITSNYVNNPFLVDDAAGSGTTYNVYTMTLATPYTAPPAGGHRHQITRA